MMVSREVFAHVFKTLKLPFGRYSARSFNRTKKWIEQGGYQWYWKIQMLEYAKKEKHEKKKILNQKFQYLGSPTHWKH